MTQSKKNSSRVIELPLVTLRGLAITPSIKAKIPLARECSIEAMREAQANGHQVALFTQKNDNQIAPEINDIHKIGIIAEVIDLIPRDSRNKHAIGLIRGISRVRLLDIKTSDTNPNLRLASCETLQEMAVDDNIARELVVMLHSCVQYAIDNGSDLPNYAFSKVPESLLDNMMKCEDLSLLTDLMTQSTGLDSDTKNMLLACLDPKERAQILLSAVNQISYKNEIENRLIDQARQAMERNQKEYLLNEQMRIIKKELGVDDSFETEVAAMHRRNAALKAPAYVHDRLDREIKKYEAMSANNAESNIVRNYIETIFSVPWEKKTEISRDLKKAKEILDEDHYGLTKVKDRILEYLAVQTRSEKLHGPIICLMGPPGIGKTSLGQSLAKATGRKFVRLSLGGVHDEAEIRGHRRTYIGALPGRIINNMIKCGVNNPLFLLDEIDKTSANSIHGDPDSALLEVLDPEQNSSFEDNYLELEYDLSNVMFVTTANSYNISGPLLDRMEIIDLSSYTEDEKFNIAKEHLLPKEMRNCSITADEFELTDEAILELIRYYTHEAGVRSLERLLNEICRKVIKDNLLSDSKAEKSKIKACDLEKLLGPRRYDFTSKLKDNRVGLVNGLAWTALGGDILQLEVVANDGKGKHILTGKLGEVMKESISAAITLVRSKAAALHLDPSFYEKSDIHVHVPEGAIPKEGPSAGVGMVTGIVSALTGNPVRAEVAMTGEITLRGDVLPIGGLKEKLLAALRGGIKTALIPFENTKDLFDVPDNVKNGLKIIPCKRIEDVLKVALENDPDKFIPTTSWKVEKSKPARAAARSKSSRKADAEAK